MEVIDGVGYEFDEPKKWWIVEGFEDDFSEKNLTILDEIEGYPVCEIGSYAFSNCKCLESVVLPKSIYMICAGAFNRCDNLQKVIIDGNKAIFIHSDAFNCCENLITVDAKHRKMAILDGAFRFCKSLKFLLCEISILMEYAFVGCCNINTLMFADDAKISEKSLMSAVVERLHFQGSANIKEPNIFKHELSPNTKIRCTSKFPYTDWAYDGCQVFVAY